MAYSAHHPHTPLSSERGAALLVVLMSTTLLMALGAGLTMLAITEQRIAGHFVAGIEALYAADAAIERVSVDLAAAPDWAPVVAGTMRSTFVDGPPGAVPPAAPGAALDLLALTNVERCGRPVACADDDASRAWRLYGYGPIRDLLPAGRTPSAVYVVVWVAAGEGAGVVLVRARAYGPSAARRAVEAEVVRSGHGVRLVAWRQL